MRNEAIVFGVAALAGALCALPAVAQEPSVKIFTTTLTSSGAHKECVSLSDVQKLRYWFRADAPIDFSIQYTTGSEVAIPVRLKKAAIGTGTYVPKVADVHCMVLTNASGKPVTARLEFARINR